MSMKPSKPNRFDLFPAVIIILLGILSLLLGSRLLAGNGSALTAEISIDGVITKTYVLPSLPEQGLTLTLENSGETLAVLLERDGVSVVSSTCSGHDCVRTGKITKAGRSIICLPARIVITLINGGAKEDAGIDIYAG